MKIFSIIVLDFRSLQLETHQQKRKVFPNIYINISQLMSLKYAIFLKYLKYIKIKNQKGICVAKIIKSGMEIF